MWSGRYLRSRGHRIVRAGGWPHDPEKYSGRHFVEGEEETDLAQEKKAQSRSNFEFVAYLLDEWRRYEGIDFTGMARYRWLKMRKKYEGKHFKKETLDELLLGYEEEQEQG